MQITVSTDSSAIRRLLQGAEKQARFATALALTRTAQDVRLAIPQALEQVFDRPTTFTKRGTYVKMARRDSLVSEVGFRGIQSRYLRLQAEGGTYTPGPAGIRLPGNIQLNAFGNIPRGLIDKLKAAADNGQLSAAIARRLGASGRRKDQRGKPLQLFYGKPQGKGWEGAPLGIWRRVPGVAGGPGKLIPVIVFEDTPARYRKRLDMEQIAMPVVQRVFERHLAAALRQSIGSAKG